MVVILNEQQILNQMNQNRYQESIIEIKLKRKHFKLNTLENVNHKK